MGTAGFDHLTQRYRFSPDAFNKMLERRLQLLLGIQHTGQLNGGRDDIIAGLALIDMIIRVYVDTLLFAEVGNHLVDVHIGTGAGAGLKNVDRKMFPVLSVDQLLGGGNDGFSTDGWDWMGAVAPTATEAKPAQSGRDGGGKRKRKR